jgi:hypothetical protein
MSVQRGRQLNRRAGTDLVPDYGRPDPLKSGALAVSLLLKRFVAAYFGFYRTGRVHPRPSVCNFCSLSKCWHHG